MAYAAIQNTKPQTLAYAQQDSPVGLLAWILEKYWEWSGNGTDLWQTFQREDILDTVMIYWLTGRVLSAARIYYEHSRALTSDKIVKPISILTWITLYVGGTITNPFVSLIDTKDIPKLVKIVQQPKGGYFAALEVPDIWAKDVAASFSKL